MKTLTLSTAALALALAAAVATTAFADDLGDGRWVAPPVEQAGPIRYVNGGAGEESFGAIEQMRSRFTVRNLFSGRGGRYVVAEQVRVQGPGASVTEIRDAGPLLMLDLPPGRYTIEADVDGQVQRKTVQVAQQPVQLNWRWPGA